MPTCRAKNPSQTAVNNANFDGIVRKQLPSNNPPPESTPRAGERGRQVLLSLSLVREEPPGQRFTSSLDQRENIHEVHQLEIS